MSTVIIDVNPRPYWDMFLSEEGLLKYVFHMYGWIYGYDIPLGGAVELRHWLAYALSAIIISAIIIVMCRWAGIIPSVLSDDTSEKQRPLWARTVGNIITAFLITGSIMVSSISLTYPWYAHKAVQNSVAGDYVHPVLFTDRYRPEYTQALHTQILHWAASQGYDLDAACPQEGVSVEDMSIFCYPLGKEDIPVVIEHEGQLHELSLITTENTLDRYLVEVSIQAVDSVSSMIQ